MTERKNNIASRVVLAAIIGFHLAATAVWLALDRSYLKLDAWEHQRYSLEVFDFLKGVLRLDPRLGMLEPLNWHGLLVGLATAPFYFVFGTGQDAAVMINSCIFFPILIISTYLLAKKISGAGPGLLAAAVLSFYPLIFNNLRLFMLDLPLAAMVTLSLYFLACSEGFSVRKYSLLFGLTAGLGLLVKFNFAAFLIGPFILAAFSAKKGARAKILRNLLSLSLIAVIICSAFYLLKANEIWQHIHESSNVHAFQVYKNVSPGSFLKWKAIHTLELLTVLVGRGFSFLFFLPFLPGLALFHKNQGREKWGLYLVLLLPLAVYAFFLFINVNCMFRYYMPALPVVAVITCVGLFRMPDAFLRKAVFSLILVLGLVQFFAVSFGLRWLPSTLKSSLSKTRIPIELIYFEQNMLLPPFWNDKTSHPSTADWRVSDVLGLVLNSRAPSARVKVASLSNIPELFEGLEYEIRSRKETVDLIPAGSITMDGQYTGRLISLEEISSGADYMITADNRQTPWGDFLISHPEWRSAIIQARREFHSNRHEFRLLKKLPLPDGSDLLLYKRKRTSMEASLDSGDSKLVFDNGRARIFYRGRELTTGLGLYVSFFSRQHWRDSREAVWRLKESSPGKMVVAGRWLAIPVSQTWEIEKISDNAFRWTAKTEFDENSGVQKQHYKLMLADDYRNWFADGGKTGEFPEGFQKDAWNPVWSGSSNEVGAFSSPAFTLAVPKIGMSVEKTALRCAVENSDGLFNGRVIGFAGGAPKAKEEFSALVWID